MSSAAPSLATRIQRGDRPPARRGHLGRGHGSAPTAKRRARSASRTIGSCVIATTAAPSSRRRAMMADELGPGGGILPEGRLVEHHDLRAGREHRRDRRAGASRRPTACRVRAGERAEPQALEQLIDARRDLGRRRPSARGPTSSSARTVVVSSWCSGSWKTVPMRVRSARDGHAIGSPSTPPDSASRGRRRARTPGGSRPASVRPSVDLPAPLGPVMPSASPARTARSSGPATAVPRTRETTSASAASSALPGGRDGGGGNAGGMPGTHTPPAASSRAPDAEHGIRRAVGDRRPSRRSRIRRGR